MSTAKLTILRIIAALEIIGGASLVAIFVIMTFSITEDKAYEVRAQLEKRRGERHSQG